MNRAVQGDVVVVEIFDEKEWRAPADEVVDQEGQLFLECSFRNFMFHL
jgi:exosome complex exonuclease DIS3/RRP44